MRQKMLKGIWEKRLGNTDLEPKSPDPIGLLVGTSQTMLSTQGRSERGCVFYEPQQKKLDSFFFVARFTRGLTDV